MIFDIRKFKGLYPQEHAAPSRPGYRRTTPIRSARAERQAATATRTIRVELTSDPTHTSTERELYLTRSLALSRLRHPSRITQLYQLLTLAVPSLA